MTASGWTTVDELVDKLRSRWGRGAYLRAHARDEPFTPVTLAVRSPTADDLVVRLDDSLRWLRRFDAANHTGSSRQLFALEHQVRRNRVLGDNPVPVRARVDTLGELCAVLGTAGELERFDRLLAITREAEPELVEWVATHPMDALAYDESVWSLVLTTVRWIVEHDLSGLDLRQLDAPGIDTKFVERHRTMLRRLLDHRFPAEMIDTSSATFAGRYGFRAAPRYVRFRLLTPVPQLPSVLSELEVRADELAQLELPVVTVFIIENQATYLAFPAVRDAIVVFGGGYGVTVLDRVVWMHSRDIVYWGDLDTHGFAILSRLRERVPSIRSMLMDRATLLAHRAQLVSEPNPSREVLGALTPDEAALYRDLVEDVYGASVRLEQERIGFSMVMDALEPWLRAALRSPDT